MRSHAEPIPPIDLRAAEAELGRRSLSDFIPMAWSVAEPGSRLIAGWHLDAIAEHLEAVARGEISRLIINIPPRHGKSLLASVFWPAWIWTWAPERRFLYASYAQGLSTRDSLRCRRLIESPWYRERWGAGFRLTGDQNVKSRFENDRSGYRMATSVGGSATGEGGDVLVCDDPHKIEEGGSDASREAVIEWWDSTMSTRLNDPRTGAMVVIMQRLHERDLSGHLLERGGWQHLCLPAEYEPRHPFRSPADPRTEPGEPLTPERFGAAEIDGLKTALGSYAAAGQLQQLPAPAAGGIFQRSWWRYYDPTVGPPELERILQSWDLAFTAGDRADFVVGQAWGQRGAELYLLRLVRARLEFTDTLRAIRAMTAWIDDNHPDHAGHRILIEDKANGPAAISVLRHEIPGVIAVRPQGDKVSRARAASPRVEAHNVHLPGAPNAAGTDCDRTLTSREVQGFIDELAGFPAAAHDDQVDAFTQLIARLGTGGAARPRVRLVRPATAPARRVRIR